MRTWEAAEELATVVRSGVIDREGQFTLEGAARLLGVEVHYRTDFPENVSGFVIKRPGAGLARTYINAFDSPTRQRFTIARELGHVVDRTADASTVAFSFRDSRAGGRYDLREFYADHFAGALLMPEDEVREVSPGLDDPLLVSVRFDVSVAAAKQRLSRPPLART